MQSFSEYKRMPSKSSEDNDRFNIALWFTNILALECCVDQISEPVNLRGRDFFYSQNYFSVNNKKNSETNLEAYYDKHCLLWHRCEAVLRDASCLGTCPRLFQYK